jgi:predicted nucleotidyltransferase
MPHPSDDDIIATVRACLPGLMALYLFGSRADGSARPDSDVDLAVMVEPPLSPLALWEAGEGVAERLGLPVDLVDLAAAPTTLQYEIVTKGRRLVGDDDRVEDFELFVLSEARDFEIRRRPLVEAILARGRVYE